MSETPDPQVVREIARTAVQRLATDSVRGRLVETAMAIHEVPYGSVNEWHAMYNAAVEAMGNAVVTVSWPDEQPQDGRDDTRFRAAVEAARQVLLGLTLRDAERATLAALRAYNAAARTEQADVKAAQDERDGDVRAPVLLATVSGVCTCSKCEAVGRSIYRMVGKCSNCQAGPILMLYRAGDRASVLECPSCGCREVYASRRATDDEIPAVAEAAALDARDAKADS